MMDEHPRSTLSRMAVQCSPQSSWDLTLMGGLGYSSQPWGLLVPDASISGNGLPSLSMTHQHENSLYYPPTVRQVDTIMNVYKPLPGDHPNHRPTLYPSDQTSMLTAHQRQLATLYSFPDNFPGPQTRVKVPDDQYEVQVDYMATWAPKILYARVNTDTPQSQNQMNESQAITVVVGNPRDHEHSMIEEAHAPMMSFGGTLLSDDCSCSPTCPTSGAKMLNVIPQQAYKASQRHDSEGEPLVSAPTSPLQLFTTPDRNTGIVEIKVEMAEKPPYQCRFCRVTFAQRQGLIRHSKDRHSPKNQCDFCVEFTWSQGRRYVYRKHLQEEHSGFVLPSIGANPIRRRRGVEVKGQHCRKNSVARRTGC